MCCCAECCRPSLHSCTVRPLSTPLLHFSAAARTKAECDDRAPVSLQGVLALVGGREVAVGNSRLLAGQGICLTNDQAAEEAAWQAKGVLLFIEVACAAASSMHNLHACLKCCRPEQWAAAACLLRRRDGGVDCHRLHGGWSGGRGRPAARRSCCCGMSHL